MTKMHVDYERLAQVANQFENGKTAVNTLANDLQKSVSSLVQEGFITARTSDAYQVKYEQLKKSLDEAAMAVNGMGEFLRGAAQALSDTDAEIAKKLR